MKINVKCGGHVINTIITDEHGNKIDNIGSFDIHLSSFGDNPVPTADVTFYLMDETHIKGIVVTEDSLERAEKEVAFLQEMLDGVKETIRRLRS